MATYEVEHGIANAQQDKSGPRQRRPDLSTYYSGLEQVETAGTPGRAHNNANAVPTPPEISAVFRTLRDAFQMMLQENGGENDVLEEMVQMLASDTEIPPREVKGVSDEWLTGLERIPKKSLKAKDCCPICNNAFLEDKYPLVVRLPCHKSHIFDLECIQPWLKLHPTCPLDRKDLLKKEKPPPIPQDEEDGEWDDMYA